MGLFSSSVSDQVWVGPASSIYAAAAPIIRILVESWAGDGYLGRPDWSCGPATASALNALPDLERRTRALSEPSSQAAKAAHKGMKDAIKNGITAAELGNGLLKSIRSGSAYRNRIAASTTSMKQMRIAVKIADARTGLAQAEQYFVV